MSFLKSFLQWARGRAVLAVGLNIAVGLTEGVGLFMLIPLMELVGIGRQSGGAGGIAPAVQGIFAWAGLPLSLASILIAYIALVSAQALASRILQVVQADLMAGYTRFLQDRIYAVVAHADWLTFIRMRPADITQVLAVDVKRVGVVVQQGLQLLGAALLALVYLGVALTISVPLTLSALVCGVVLVFLLRPFDRRAHQAGVAIHGHFRALMSDIDEHLAGMKIAKCYGMESRHLRHFTDITKQVADWQVGFSRSNASTQMYYKIGSAVAISGFFYGAVALAGLKSAGLLLLVLIFARLLPRFSRMQQHVQQIYFCLPSFAAAEHMYADLAARQESGEPEAEPAQALGLQREIRCAGVAFNYQPEVSGDVLRDIDLLIAAGRMTAVVGPSGAGKSTLADLLLGLLTPTRGAITVDGAPLTGARLSAWRQAVGYVPQDTFLFNDSVRANLRWACPEASEEDMLAALTLAAADGFVSRLPQGLDTLLGDRGVRLSGGERQRIALARALLRRPALLILDEATSSLDGANEQRIQEAVASLHGRLTLVVIAHRLSTIREADHVVVLSGGRLVEQGSWDALAAEEAGHFYAMLNAGAAYPRGGEARAS